MSGAKIRYMGILFPLVIMGFLVTTSCEREEMGETVRLSSNRIAYNAGWSKGQAADDGLTKSGEQGGSFLMAFGDDSLFMYLYEEANRSFTPGTADGAGATKAAPIVSVSSFNVAAFTNAGNAFILKDKIEVDGNGRGASDRFWPESDPLNFFAWASSATTAFPTPNEAVSGSLNFSVSTTAGVTACNGSFSYGLPAPGTDPATAADAHNQPDLIFAITANQTKNSNQTVPGTVDMQFHHALSAIHFKVGEMPQDLTVKRIKISGVYGEGTCTFTPDSKTEKPLDLSFSWHPDGEASCTYIQNFNLTIPNDRTDMGTFDQVNGGEQKEAVFMLIPQDIPAEAMLEITFAVGANEYTLGKKLSEIANNASWEADKKYVYVISTPAEVDIEITDQVEGYVKSNLKITNTGLATSYVRAAIVGYWILEREEMVDGSTVAREDIVAAWNPATLAEGGDGDFTGLPGTNWEQGSDGFYYYKNTVSPKAEITDKLFDTYTLKANPPVIGAELRLSILVQSVIADRISEAGWPVTVNDGVMKVN